MWRVRELKKVRAAAHAAAADDDDQRAPPADPNSTPSCASPADPTQSV